MSVLFPGLWPHRAFLSGRFLEGDGGGGSGGDGDDPPAYTPPATQDDLNKIIEREKRKAEQKAKKDADAAIEQAKADAIAEHERKQAADKAKEQGEYKKVADEQATEIESLKAALAAKDAEIASAALDTLKAKIAAKHGLPEQLAARLQGTDEATLEDDAKALAAVAKPAAAPATEGGKGGGKPAATGEKSAATVPTHTFRNRTVVPFPGKEAAAKEA